MESRSEHPLASALLDYLEKEHISPLSFNSYESITGRGIKARYQDKLYFAGNEKLLLENGVKADWPEAVQRLKKEAKSLVFFAEETKLILVAGISDPIKKTSQEAIFRLKNEGIEVYMLTGDNAMAAGAVAGQVGIKNFKAELLPSDKAKFVKDLQAKGHVVAMVGDGINDSEALALADVSIAMGKGSDIAMEVAKMTLITSDLRSISKAFRLSGKIVAGVRQNLFWAFIYNLIGIPLAAGILYPFTGFLLNPMIAGAAMALSSVSVVANSLRLKYVKI